MVLASGGTAGAGTDQNYQFYKEYCRLYYANIILTNRLQQLLNEKQELQFKLNRLEVRGGGGSSHQLIQQKA